MTEAERTWRFEAAALPHLDSAFNLARWLLKNDPDAEDAVQQAYLRAFRYFDSFTGTDARGWILAIVRRSCYDLAQQRQAQHAVVESFDGDDTSVLDQLRDTSADPEMQLLQRRDAVLINQLVAALPTEFREVVVLREIEDLSYREIAEVVGVPIGTVMSRLSRGRSLLRHAYMRQHTKEHVDGL